MCDRRRDLRSISFGAVQSIPPDILGMSKVLERWVSQMLTNHQKRTQHDISRYVVSRYEDNPSDLIELVVIQYVTWIHHFDPESKLQSKQWKHPGSPPPKKSKLVHSAGKLMTSIFWDSQGVIMIDYPEQGRTINGAYYAGKLRRLRQDFAWKRRGKLTCEFCSCRTTLLPTRHKFPWLLRLHEDLESFLIPDILLIWLFLTSICSQNWNPIFVVHML